MTQLWKITVGTGDASPVLSGKNIYVHTRQGDEEFARCINGTTGKEIWKYSNKAPIVTGPSASHPGPRSTPVVANGKVFFLGIGGTLTCLDAVTGKLLWVKEDELFPQTQYNPAMSPLVTDGLCIVQLGGKDKGQTIAYKITNGAIKWKYSGEGPAHGSPSEMTVGNNKQIVLITEKGLLALDLADGKLLWQFAAPPAQRFFNASSPVIDGQTIYFSGHGSGILAIKVQKEGNLYTAKEIWNNPEIGVKFNTPVLKDGFLYGFSDQRRMFCLNAKTGQVAWVDKATNSEFATIADYGTVLIALTSTGNLLVINPDSQAYTELAKYKVAETATYTFPIVSGNLIYVKDAENLILYMIK
jgi:outer membrane protein assembly factor BamB